MNDKIKWGVQDPVKYINNENREILLDIIGFYSYQIVNDQVFNNAYLREKNTDIALTQEMFVRRKFLKILNNFFAQNGNSSFEQLQMNIGQISSYLFNVVNQNLINLGINFYYVEITNINLVNQVGKNNAIPFNNMDPDLLNRISESPRDNDGIINPTQNLNNGPQVAQAINNNIGGIVSSSEVPSRKANIWIYILIGVFALIFIVLLLFVIL